MKGTQQYGVFQVFIHLVNDCPRKLGLGKLIRHPVTLSACTVTCTAARKSSGMFFSKLRCQ